MESGKNGEFFTKAYSMIKLVKRKNINLEKYTACLHRAENYRVYAEHWYLDTLMQKQWDCFVLNDYEAIMPLPFGKKLGLKYITQPIYCQQLGVFYTEDFTVEKFHLFEKKLKRKLVHGYHFNEENQSLLTLHRVNKKNQLLNFPSDYTTYIKTIRKNRKQEIAKGLPLNYTIEAKHDDLRFISLLKENYSSIESKLYLEKLEPLAKEIINRRKGITVNLSKKNELVASSFYIISNSRLIQLCNAKKNHLPFNANTYIVDFVIKNYRSQFEILDFEGSSIPGVNSFNASFRAETVYYSKYQTKIF